VRGPERVEARHRGRRCRPAAYEHRRHAVAEPMRSSSSRTETGTAPQRQPSTGSPRPRRSGAAHRSPPEDDVVDGASIERYVLDVVEAHPEVRCPVPADVRVERGVGATTWRSRISGDDRPARGAPSPRGRRRIPHPAPSSAACVARSKGAIDRPTGARRPAPTRVPLRDLGRGRIREEARAARSPRRRRTRRRQGVVRLLDQPRRAALKPPEPQLPERAGPSMSPSGPGVTG